MLEKINEIFGANTNENEVGQLPQNCESLESQISELLVTNITDSEFQIIAKGLNNEQ